MSRKAKSGGLKSNIAKDENTEIIGTARRAATSSKPSMVPLPIEYFDPTLVSFLAKEQREQFDKGNEEEEIKVRELYVGIGCETEFSSTPLDELQIVHLDEMRYGKSERHEGRFLLCRIITPPSRMVHITFGVEDPNGWAQSVEVYNFPGTSRARGAELDTIFPIYSLMAIREPTVKSVAVVGDKPNSCIRVDSPSDIIFLEHNDPILKDVVWNNGRMLPLTATASAEEWKRVGDRHFKEKQFFPAAVAYSYALNKDPMWTTVRLNRCLAHLRLDNFVLAARDAETVLAGDNLYPAERTKALYRAALANYGSGKYGEAENYYRACFAVDSTLKEAINGVKKCRIRIQEQTHGIYDWKDLFIQGEVPCARPDVADYTGPVRVASIPNRKRGRGVIATRNIEPGEVLFVSKAFVVSFLQEDNRGRRITETFSTNKLEFEAKYDLTQQLITKIVANEHLSTSLLEIYDGRNSAQPPPGPRMDRQENIGNPLKSPIEIDITRINSLINFNTSLIRVASNVVEPSFLLRFQKDKSSEMALALHPTISFINHSCVGNASSGTMYGHVIVVRALTNIAAGEEVTRSYYGHNSLYAKRMKTTQFLDGCECSLCMSDRAAGEGFHKALDDAIVEYNEHSSKPNPVSLEVFRKIINKIDALYPLSYHAYRPMVSVIHDNLSVRLRCAAAKSTSPFQQELLLLEAIEHLIVSLRARGLQVTDKDVSVVRPSSRRRIRLPVALNRVPYDTGLVCINCWNIANFFTQLGNDWRAEMWVRGCVMV